MRLSRLFTPPASKHRVGYLLSGINFRTEGIHVREWSQGHLDSRYIHSCLQAIYRQAARAFPAHSGFNAGTQHCDASAAQRLSARLSGLRQAVGKAFADRQNYGWEDYGGKHYESVYTRFYQGWILPHKFGYDKRRMHLSTLICSGQMTRAAGAAGNSRARRIRLTGSTRIKRLWRRSWESPCRV